MNTFGDTFGFSDELADLQEGALKTMAVFDIVLGYLWLHWEIRRVVPNAPLADPGSFICGWVGCLLLLIGSTASCVLRTRVLRVARHTLVWSSLLAGICAVCAFRSGEAVYLLVIPVVFANVLVGPRAFLLTAFLAILTAFVIDPAAGRVPTSLVNRPLLLWPVAALVRLFSPGVAVRILVLSLVTVAAWLSSNNLYTALAWFHSGYQRARRNERIAQDQRGELGRVLKALDEAYRRLERSNYMLMLARDEAETARRSKQDFAQNISHELRTPLNLIMGFSETMANAPETYGAATWSPSLRGDVEQIYRSSRHLSSLIDDILDLAAVEAHKLSIVLEQASIRDVVTEAVGIVEALFRAKNLDLRVDVAPDLPRVYLDSTRVRQILLNLLTNASRHTLHGGVTVKAYLVDDEIQLSVADTGVGIAADDIPKVFQEFGRIEGAIVETKGGTGLGMPLSKRLVELHGGHMWLDSVPGKGSVFYFTLPVSSEPATRLARLDREGGLPRGEYSACRKGLLVHDADPLLLHTLRKYLDGYDIVGLQADKTLGALVDEYKPIAIIADSRDTHTPDGGQPDSVVVSTNLPVVEFPLRTSLARADQLGIRDYLLKPVARPQLLAAVDGLDAHTETVLVVDDDPQLVELIVRMLESGCDGVQVDRAYSGDDALAGMRHRRPDLVLLDLVMPGTDGLGVLRTMRNDPFLSNIPVIAVSGRDYLELAGGAHSLAVRRAEKFSGAELLKCLQSLVDAMPTLPAPQPERVPQSGSA